MDFRGKPLRYPGSRGVGHKLPLWRNRRDPTDRRAEMCMFGAQLAFDGRCIMASMMSDGGHHQEQTSYRLPPPGEGPAVGSAAVAAGGEEHIGAGDDRMGAGRLVGSRYRLLERLGAGGMGTVWRARDEVVDRDVAIKEPRVPEHFTPAEQRTAYARMQREARAAARIDHPSVVAIFDVVTEGERPWIVMELLHGRSLAEVLDEGTLAPPEAARIALAVLGALTAAHEAGVLHRDVKPGNVMIGRHERVVLTDFGIAQVEGEQKLTETGAFIGSPEYIAPERVLGRRPGPESDLWSLGVMLYQALEGVSPFRRQTTPSTLQAILLSELVTPQHSGGLTSVITGLLRKDPEERLTATDAKQLLYNVAHPPASPPPTRAATVLAGAPTATAEGRRRLWLAGAAAAVVLAVVIAVTLALTGDDLPDGWKRYEEYRMQLTVAAPADWTITTEDNLGDSTGAITGTRYTSLKGDMSLLVNRKQHVTETALGIGQRWEQENEAGTPPTGGSPAVASVTPTTHQGRDAALFTMTYSQAGEGTPRRLDKTLIVTTSKGERVTVAVDVPAGKSGEKIADDLLSKARSELRIDNL
ncbi:serine/threonine-protein kinase [Streptomyces sp. NPDC096205]|uniref:serine/threonine-protein kinase n=1 Tax=Streptomyces sp. NPDC096205 TaxID=3366081 RepID=UPI00380A9547